MRFRFFFFLIVFFTCRFAQAVTAADRLADAKAGDFIVTEQDKNYSLLLLREKTSAAIVFEEISIPCHKIHLPGMNWEDWTALGAPGHTSWIQYEIDPRTLKLVECYSYSKKGWLYIEESEHFFSKLLSLKLTRVPVEERKKIGPAPVLGEPDRRPFWIPTLVIDSKKVKIPCDILKASWPKDDTLLSSCTITLYFPSEEKSFFPIRIEADNGHFKYSIRGIYKGKNLISPIKTSVPKRALKIIKSTEKTESQRVLKVKAPSYYESFSVFVFDASKPDRKIGPIPFSFEKDDEKELYTFRISTKDLFSFLSKNHRYKWVIQARGSAESVCESDDFFLWNP